jgi:hypothetical protein
VDINPLDIVSEGPCNDILLEFAQRRLLTFLVRVRGSLMSMGERRVAPTP